MTPLFRTWAPRLPGASTAWSRWRRTRRPTWGCTSSSSSCCPSSSASASWRGSPAASRYLYSAIPHTLFFVAHVAVRFSLMIYTFAGRATSDFIQAADDWPDLSWWENFTRVTLRCHDCHEVSQKCSHHLIILDAVSSFEFLLNKVSGVFAKLVLLNTEFNFYEDSKSLIWIMKT